MDFGTYLDQTLNLKPDDSWVVPRAWWIIANEIAILREADHRDRHAVKSHGEHGVTIDRIGAFGEILVAELLGGVAKEHLAKRMLSQSNGLDGDLPDAEIKTFDCSPNKRFLAINASKHRRYTNITRYIAVFVQDYGQLAWTTIIPYEEVSQWQHFDFRKNGDYAFAKPILELTGESTIPMLRSGGVFSEDSLRHIKEGAAVAELRLRYLQVTKPELSQD